MASRLRKSPLPNESAVLKTVRAWSAVLGLAICAAVVLEAMVETYVVESESMEPVLSRGDRVLTCRDRRIWYRIRPGSIIAFRDPKLSPSYSPRASALPAEARMLAFLMRTPHLHPRELVKRVIAIGHDLVCVEKGVVYVNGLPSPWVRGTIPRDVRFSPCKVPADAVFVLGEDLAVSRDSRDFGPVSRSLVTGKILAVYWPVTRIRPLTSLA